MLNNVACHLLGVWERERAAVHVRNCVYLSKIENNSYYQELVSLPIPAFVDELSSLNRIKQQHPFPDSY